MYAAIRGQAAPLVLLALCLAYACLLLSTQRPLTGDTAAAAGAEVQGVVFVTHHKTGGHQRKCHCTA